VYNNIEDIDLIVKYKISFNRSKYYSCKI